MGTKTKTQLNVEPNPLDAGQDAEVSIQGGPANQTVTVDVTDGGTPPQTDQVKVDLDANGYGSAKWPVPDWDLAIFSYDGIEVARPIV